MRCPICSVFEQNVGPTIDKDVKDGKFKVSYHIGAFLDRNMGGTGAKNALSAVGAALNVSPEAFAEYNKALYAKENHPEETKDDFAKGRLPAEDRPAGPGPQGQQGLREERQGRHLRQVGPGVCPTRSTRTRTSPAHPTIKLDGKKLTAEGSENPPMTGEQFTSAVNARLK
ncbi:hypothetical protein GCM10020221_01690 [Streptomyces thioluteus]|uniref:Thioredoxin-like fold domain-containing protein n=1 Tax=Streptomyces thioluteus TaxID=66431 RepID=A0ABN3WBD4_STRTU